jgi:hypothetical protein
MDGQAPAPIGDDPACDRAGGSRQGLGPPIRVVDALAIGGGPDDRAAQAMKGDRPRFIEAGFDGYLSKPVDIDAFLATVEQHCEARAG